MTMTYLTKFIKNILLALLINIWLVFSLQAASKVYVKVLGMVCSFCATSIEEVLTAQSQVESVDINLDNKVVTINLKDRQDLSDAQIKELFLAAGYDVDKIGR